TCSQRLKEERGDVMDCQTFRDDMLDVLYGEGGEAAARRVEAHQAVCAECRREMADLRRLRADLAQWRLPEPLLAAPAPAPPARRLPLGLAAAAGLIVALGGAFALSGAEVRYDGDGFSAHMGRVADARALAEAERRHRAEMADLRAELATRRARDEQALLARVAEMVRESESRQDAVRLASLRELRERTETQRHYDLARVSA